jgi:glycosyltransferase involved in cell wall biosynthesis
MQELLAKKTGARDRIEYVPNWVDIADFSVVQRSSEDAFHVTRKDRVVFQLFGNLGRVQGIEVILEAIAKVRSKNATFLFIGSGAGESAVKAFIDRNPHLDVVHAPSVPFERNTEILSACDVAIVPLTSGMLGLAVPSKAYFSMAVDKPILVVGDEGSELQTMLSENPQVGWFCRSGSAERLASLIEEICETDRAGIVNKPRTLVAEKYSHDKMIDRYAAIIEGLSAVSTR